MNCSFDFSLCLPPVRSAQNRLKSIEARKILKLPVQGRILLLEQAFYDNLFHVVVQDFLRISAKVPECILMPAYEGICAHVCYKFYVPRTAFVNNPESSGSSKAFSAFHPHKPIGLQKMPNLPGLVTQAWVSNRTVAFSSKCSFCSCT